MTTPVSGSIQPPAKPQIHGNEAHDPDFEEEGVAAALVEAHRTTGVHTQDQPPAEHGNEAHDPDFEEEGVAASLVGDHEAAADPHTGYIRHALATVVGDFLVASGAGVFIKQTLAQVRTLLNWAADIAAHAADTSTHGVADIADVSDIAVDANLSAAGQDAIAKRHTQGTDDALGALGTKATPVNADKVIQRNSADSDALVTSTWTQIKAFLKTYFDTLYEAIGAVAAHAGLTATHGATGAVVGTTNTQTLTNKTLIDTTNVVEEIRTFVSTSTPIPTGGSLRNFFTLTALAVNATFITPSGTPANGNKIIIRVKDNGTARTLGWNVIYRAMEFALPTTTVSSKTMYLGFIYNSADTKWDMVAINEEA